MKTIFTFLLGLFFCTSLFSQNSKLVSAWNYLREGDIIEAKKAIDEASKNETTMNLPKTFWYKGLVYNGINDRCMYGKKESKYCDLDPNALDIAYKSYAKAITLNLKDPQYQSLDIITNKEDKIKFIGLLRDSKTKYISNDLFVDIFSERFPSLIISFYNKGDIARKSEYFTEALQYFKNGVFISSLTGKIDTVSLYACAITADEAKQTDDAIKFYEVLIYQLNYGKTEEEKAKTYYFLAKDYKIKGNTDKAIETINKGIAACPNSNSFLITELVNIYIESGKTEEAIKNLDIAIQKDTSNPVFHYAKGTLYEKIEKPDEAINSYNKALQIKPNFFEASYNLGGIYYNQAAKTIEAANKLPVSQAKKYELEILKAKSEFKKSLPYLEKAYLLNPNDEATMRSLKEIYYRLDIQDKYKEIMDKINNK